MIAFHRRLIALASVFLPCASLQAQYTYSGSGNWDTAANWTHSTNNGEVPGTNLDEQAVINGGSTVTLDSTQPSIRALRLLGGSGIATLNINSGASLDVTTSSAWDSSIGRNGADGIVNQTGGDIDINFLELGRDNGRTGEYYLSGGILNITRGGNNATGGASLIMGTADSNSSGGTATGLMEITGGTFRTRAGVWLGGTGGTPDATFRVLGSGASEIGIGTTNTGTDGNWTQNSGAILQAGIDFSGVSKILIDDHGNGNNFAIFKAGSLLDVDYYNGFAGGGTWTVLELENGTIDAGALNANLSFAPGVDTNLWSFDIVVSGANSLLQVTSSDPVLRDAYWDGSENTTWEEPLNWTNNFGAFDTSYVHIDFGTVDYTASSDSDINLRGFRMTDGTLNISGGLLRATQLASGYSQMDGTTNHTGGTADINALELGRGTSSNANYMLSGGELKIGRAKNGVSLYLGSNSSSSNSGSGTLTISGGKFTTRNGVRLGSITQSGTGKFVVLGADASEVTIAGANDDTDGYWEQSSGSTLEFGIDFAGATPIVIKDSATNTDGTYATFESGSLLDVDYYNITEGGGTWVVMEVENGSIDAGLNDANLSFAPGVDPNIWSFTIDNSGTNGRLLVSAVGDPLGYDITIGNTEQQKMRYGMDYERLWFWSKNSNESSYLDGNDRDDVARWSAVDTDIDFVRVATYSRYELVENTYDLAAYTNKIIPVMQDMKDANPNIKFFASPRPLNEAHNSIPGFGKNDINWQPYPIWITGAPDYDSGAFSFNPTKCAQYLIRYLRLMKHYGFKISFLDLTNEWQSNDTSSSFHRITQADARDVVEYIEDYIDNPPAPASDPTDPTGFYAANYPTLDASDMPQIVAPSSWNYSQGGSWISGLDTQRRKDAVDIASSHNTNRSGSAAAFASQVETTLGTDTEIWNTELHGWKSTSSENETTSFRYYIETIRAGFGGINGWLAIGTTDQGHSYILNPSGTPTRNVKYHIYQKLSSTSNYGHALDILAEPASSTFTDTSDDYDTPRSVAAFIKGNLMTVWVINDLTTPAPVVITPSGNTIAGTDVRVTRWNDPSDVEGFESFIPVTSNTSFGTTIQGESVYCFEITLGTETFAQERIEAEDSSHQWGTTTETAGDVDGNENVANISDGDWRRYGAVALDENSKLNFRVARPSGRPNSIIRVREGSADGAILGSVSVPETGNWQSYQTIETDLVNTAGIYNLYLEFVEDGSSTNNAFVNLNWFSVNESAAAPPVTGLAAATMGASQIDLTWDANAGVDSFNLKRALVSEGPFDTVASGLTGTSHPDTELASGEEYFYVISGVLGGNEGPDSTVVSARTLTAPPENFQAVATGETTIDLSWDPAVGAQGYRLYRADIMSGPYSQIMDVFGATTYTDTMLTAGTRYYYIAESGSNIGLSLPSEEASAMPFQAIVPENLVISSGEFGDDGSGNEQLSFTVEQTGLGQFYQVQRSDTLHANEWISMGPIYSGNGGQLLLDVLFDYSDPDNYKHFFRVGVWTE